MALSGFELETLVSKPDALSPRPPSCALLYACNKQKIFQYIDRQFNIGGC